MDLLRRKRQSSAQSLQGLAADSPTSSSAAGSSPASSVYENRNGGFFTSVKRSLSRASTSPPLGNSDSSMAGTPGSPGRRVLHKHTGSLPSFDGVQSRSSVTSEGYRRLSRAYSLSLSSSRSFISGAGIDWKTAIDWKTQLVEAHCALEADPQALRGKSSYLIVTQDYIVKMRSRAEAVAAFPQIGSMNRREMNSIISPDPVLVIPVHMLVSVFLAESSRPSFGIEIWWRSSSCRASYCSTQLYFGLPRDRSEMMATMVTQLKAKNLEFPEASLVPLEVEAQIMKIFAEEEPGFKTCKPEIFPVVRRMPVREDAHSNKLDKARRAQDGSSWYLAVGRNLCYLAEAGPGLPVDVKYQTWGLVTLDAFRANWAFHEERFVLSFREPFKPAVTLELASRYYRQIVITFMKADRFLKPCWPTTLQTLEVFRVSGLTDPQLLIAGDNYGGLKRTLDAFLSAYHCPSVEWEINWKTALAPEFRLLPPKTGDSYTNLQLLAVMRSLRYNGYFNSISFHGIDLTGLWDKVDSMGRTPVPYMNRSCLALSEVELGHVRFGSLLHQEMHALAFCSESVRQIDLTNCFTAQAIRRRMPNIESGPGFLFPILNLLELGLTKCNRLLLSGNYLRPADIEGLVEAMMTQTVEIQALDISKCNLSDTALRDIFEVMFHQGHSLQSLDVSGNRGRVHAYMIANLSHIILDLRKLNVSGILMGDIPGPVFSFETLSRFEYLEELDLSKFKVNDATLCALEAFLAQKPLPSEPYPGDFSGPSQNISTSTSTFRKLSLNNCGINGREAARLIRALGSHTNAHLYINGNPLEDGIDDFCRAISQTPGPAGLHMDMLEFRHETNFVAVMKALAVNSNISVLSMAGTAPIPSADGPCGSEVCDALDEFFQRNKSVKYLDLSGYSGKLDEGQLGRGFARSLRGLVSNNTLTHLRIRNQNLHDDVGTLGSVIRQNSTLRIIDCQDNSWNLTSIQFLVKSLKLNKTIVQFPFPQKEYERVWSRVVADIRRQSVVSKAAIATQQEKLLHDTLQKQIQELQQAIQRNRALLEDGSAFAVDFEDLAGPGAESGWPDLGVNMSKGNINAGKRTKRPLSIYHHMSTTQQQRLPLHLQQPTPSPVRLLDFELDSDLMTTPIDPPVAQITRKVHEIPVSIPMKVHSDAVEVIDIPNPYHISQDPDILLLLETPPGTLTPVDDSTGRASPTTPEIPVSPMTPPPTTVLDLPNYDTRKDNATGTESPGDGGSVSLGDTGSSRMTRGFDMGPYLNGGRESAFSRLRVGGLEAHVEE